MTIPISLLLSIQGNIYKQINTDYIKEGDFLLDTQDNCWGICRTLYDDGTHLAIGSGGATEVGVPKSRVRKLILNHSSI